VKNVQVIDGAGNSVFEIYAVSDDEFDVVFKKGTDIAFPEDVAQRIAEEYGETFWNSFYRNRVDKKRVKGIHGTLHLSGSCCRKEWFPTLQESEVIDGRDGRKIPSQLLK